MAWYRTGTISLTNGSTAVTGSGTAWISNAAVGEALLAQDGKLYEIANIASDTSITLGSIYLGTTQSGQAYVIVPSQSYIRDLAAKAAALVNNYSTFYNTVGQGKFPDGAVATPAISFSNDTNTGLYRSAADEVTLVANGVAIAKWNTSGFSFVSGVSTITANSTSPALKITQTGTGNALVVEDSASDATPFVIDQSGNVGIGTGSPESGGLTVAKGGDFSLVLKGNDYVTAQIRSYRESSSDHAQVNAFAARGTEAAPAILVAGDRALSIKAFGWDGATWIEVSQIRAEVDGTPGLRDMPGRLVFSTTADGAYLSAERLRIDSSGNVLVKSAAGLGYGTGAGGQVTQTGSRTTGVTLSKPTGAITLVSAAGSTSWQSFTVTNTVVAAEDVVVVSQKSGADLYEAHVTNVAAGSFRISFRTTGGTTTEQPVFSFAVIKGAIA